VVQVLVDVILWMYPFMAFSTGLYHHHTLFDNDEIVYPLFQDIKSFYLVRHIQVTNFLFLSTHTSLYHHPKTKG
jgi:hypothetical protein